MKKGDIVRRKDGKQISYLLPGDGMTCPVAIEPGGEWGAYGWHYVHKPIDRIAENVIGLKIGLFPTWEQADDYELVKG